VVVHRTRWGQAAVVVLVLVGIFATSVRAAEAAAPTSAAPLFSRGVPWYARGVGGPLGLPMVIGGVAWEGYRLYKEHRYLDVDVPGVDVPYCGSYTHEGISVQGCASTVGVQGSRWVMAFEGEVTGNIPTWAVGLRANLEAFGPYIWPALNQTGEMSRNSLSRYLPMGPGGGEFAWSGQMDQAWAYGYGASDSVRQWYYLQPERLISMRLQDTLVANASQTLQLPALVLNPDNQRRVEPSLSNIIEYECYHPDLNTTTYHTANGGPVEIVDGHAVLQSPALDCPEGSVLVGMDHYVERDDGLRRDHAFSWDQSQDWWDAMDDQDLATCLLLEGLADVECQLEVYRKLTPTTQPVGWEDLQECSPYAGNCANWYWQPDRDAQYQCMWSTPSRATAAVLPLNECQELMWYYNPEHAYQIVPSPSTVPSPWPQDQPWSPGQPQPWPNPVPQPGEYPSTWPGAQPQPNPDLYPQPQPGGYPWPGTSTPTNPGSSPGTGTGTVTLPDPTPSQDPDNCWAGALSWNPLDWVLTPVKCALSWAFVPSEATWTNMQDLGQHAATRVPFSWFADAFGWFEPLQGTGTACLQLSFPVMGETVTAIDSCTPGPAEGWIMARRTMLSVVTYGLLVVPLAWWAWRQYAPGSQGMA
jgi:hypothetical protein